jgi:4'-phosphopantetheinyl transferase
MIETAVACGAGTLRLHRLETVNAAFDLWCCRTEDVPPNALERPETVGWLSDEERKRHSRFHFTRDRDLFLTTRLLARSVLSQYAAVSPQAWEFRSGPWGRPEIDPDIAAHAGVTGLNFNLSRSGALAVCAVTHHGTVGVDVEDVLGRVDATEAAASVLTEKEMLALNALSEKERRASFLQSWVLKEAFVKAGGKGLSFDVKRVAYDLPNKNQIKAELDGQPLGESENWYFTTMRLFERYLVAVALEAHSGAAATASRRASTTRSAARSSV